MVSGSGFRVRNGWGRALAAIALPLMIATTASAHWTVVNLHPSGTRESMGYGVGGGQQVGFANMEWGVRHASLWNGTSDSWVDLNPAGADASQAYGVSGGQQVGSAWVRGVECASLWSGTAGSWVNLHPAGANESVAYGVGDGRQVGWALLGGVRRASLWSGTAASWVDLNPAGSTESQAHGAGGGQQVGNATIGGVRRASLWSGTAGSWVDLAPAGVSYSDAYGVDGGQQVGHAYVGGADHACLWRGTAGSWVDLNPAGASSSHAYGVGDGQQVGEANVGGVRRASLWSGTAASWVDLHVFLPSNFAGSSALGIWSDGIFTYVVGHGHNTTTSRDEALMWVSSVLVPPSLFTVTRGFRIDGGLAELLQSDDGYVAIQQRPPFLASDPNIQVVVEGSAPLETTGFFRFRLEASCNAFPLARAPQRIELYDYRQGRWETVDERTPTFNDSVVEVSFTDNADRFIEPGTRAIKARIGYFDRGTLAPNWFAAIDQTVWEIGP